LPLHIYEGQSGKLITSILRPGCRPTGQELVSILKRVVKAMRRKWPAVTILLRGDGHFSTPEVHQWCASQEPVIYYVLGQSGNAVLQREASGLLEPARSLYHYKQVRAWRKHVQAAQQRQKSKAKTGAGRSEKLLQSRATEAMKAKLYTTFAYQAASWTSPQRILCKAEVSEEGENLRFVVTNLETPRNAWIYETIYCGRGQMEN
jgi:Transposase DDE domain group 1